MECMPRLFELATTKPVHDSESLSRYRSKHVLAQWMNRHNLNRKMKHIIYGSANGLEAHYACSMAIYSTCLR